MSFPVVSPVSPRHKGPLSLEESGVIALGLLLNAVPLGAAKSSRPEFLLHRLHVPPGTVGQGVRQCREEQACSSSPSSPWTGCWPWVFPLLTWHLRTPADAWKA